jgi:hypothetical protein
MRAISSSNRQRVYTFSTESSYIQDLFPHIRYYIVLVFKWHSQYDVVPVNICHIEIMCLDVGIPNLHWGGRSLHDSQVPPVAMGVAFHVERNSAP